MLADLVLVGFGHVGRRFVGLLDEQRERLATEFDLVCRVVGIATGRHGAAWCASGLDVDSALRSVTEGRPLTSVHDASEGTAPADGFDLIARLSHSAADLRVVIETTTLDISAGQPAIDHVRAAISAGCHAVTANKGPAAFAYADLRSEAESADVSFLFEGAVMDGVPVFNLVRETMPAVTILGFRGVVNSTTNHILSALEDGEAFGPALARMQADGIAEADPSLDIDGWDAAAKTAALANVLMDARITPHLVARTGIDERSGHAAREALASGHRLRLVAAASRRENGQVVATVQPMVLAGDDLLASLRGQANALVLRTDLLGEIAICQMEGSLTHTAYALLGDLVTIRRRQRAPAGATARRSP